MLSLENEATAQTADAVNVVQSKLESMTEERNLYMAKFKEADTLLDEARSFQAVRSDLMQRIERLTREKADVETQFASRARDLETKHITDILRLKREKEEDVLRTRQDMQKAMSER
jgi:hypothetical protein